MSLLELLKKKISRFCWKKKKKKKKKNLLVTISSRQCLDMIDGNIENGLERGFVKHRLNYVLIIDPKSLCRTCVASCSFPNIRVLNGRDSFGQSMNLGLSV